MSIVQKFSQLNGPIAVGGGGIYLSDSLNVLYNYSKSRATATTGSLATESRLATAGKPTTAGRQQQQGSQQQQGGNNSREANNSVDANNNRDLWEHWKHQ